jgi:hypothetical protein
VGAASVAGSLTIDPFVAVAPGTHETGDEGAPHRPVGMNRPAGAPDGGVTPDG